MVTKLEFVVASEFVVKVIKYRRERHSVFVTVLGDCVSGFWLARTMFQII